MNRFCAGIVLCLVSCPNHDIVSALLPVSTLSTVARRPQSQDALGFARGSFPTLTRMKARRKNSRSMALRMADDREEAIKAKIAKLRGAASKGDSYEQIMGEGKAMTEKMKKNEETFKTVEEREAQKDLRDKVVVRGKREDAVSELEEGRRTVVRDEDDPEFEVNTLDGLTKSDEESYNRLMETAVDVSEISSGGAGPNKFDGGFSNTMSSAEAFLSRTSTFDKLQDLKRSKEAKEEEDEGAKEEGAEEGKVPLQQDSNASNGEDEMRRTGSVGGRWDGPPPSDDVGTHKPAVGSWGVFERPKDISKAFGGGRDPRQRRVDPEEEKKRAEETRAILERYRGVANADLEKETANEGKIQVALEQAKRAMRYGDTYGAVSALEEVKGVCSTNGPLGAVVFLELGMALEATGRSSEAQDIYKLLRRSKNRDVKSKARRLNEGLEAMEFLKYSRPGEAEVVSEFSRMWSASYEQMSLKTDDRFTTTYFVKDIDGRPEQSKVFSVNDAKDVLLAADGFKGSLSQFRVLQAFEFLKDRSEDAARAVDMEREALQQKEETGLEVARGVPVKEEEAEGGESKMLGEGEGRASPGLMSLVGDPALMRERLKGTWRFAIKADRSVQYIKKEACLTLGGGSDGMAAVLLEPSGLASIEKVGTWVLDKESRIVSLQFQRATWGGLFPREGGQEDLGVIAVDEKTLVTDSLTPGLKANPARPPKYRLWVRDSP